MSFTLRQFFIPLSLGTVVLGLWISQTNRERNNHAIMSMRMEAMQLEYALQIYREEIGGLPPSSKHCKIETYLAAYYDGATGDELFGPQRDIEDIASNELLFLLLYELPVATQRGVEAKQQSYFYEFDRDRLVDADNDGWLEYVSECRTDFYYLKGKVDAFNPSTGKLMSADW